jgi:hypothetical protein
MARIVSPPLSAAMFSRQSRQRNHLRILEKAKLRAQG